MTPFELTIRNTISGYYENRGNFLSFMSVARRFFPHETKYDSAFGVPLIYDPKKCTKCGIHYTGEVCACGDVNSNIIIRNKFYGVRSFESAYVNNNSVGGFTKKESLALPLMECSALMGRSGGYYINFNSMKNLKQMFACCAYMYISKYGFSERTIEPILNSLKLLEILESGIEITKENIKEMWGLKFFSRLEAEYIETYIKVFDNYEEFIEMIKNKDISKINELKVKNFDVNEDIFGYEKLKPIKSAGWAYDSRNRIEVFLFEEEDCTSDMSTIYLQRGLITFNQVITGKYNVNANIVKKATVYKLKNKFKHTLATVNNKYKEV